MKFEDDGEERGHQTAQTGPQRNRLQTGLVEARHQLDVTMARLNPEPPLPAAHPLAKQMPTRGMRIIAIGQS